MVATSSKMNFTKRKPIERTYREMKYFDRETFYSELISELSKIGSDYNIFNETFNTDKRR